MALVQLSADLLRIAHGGHGLLGGRLFRDAPLHQRGGVVLHMGGQFGGNGRVVGRETDMFTHLGAEVVEF